VNQRDDYIKSPRAERRLGLPADQAAGGDQLAVTEEDALEAGARLERLDWGRGLTRDEIRLRYRELPLGIYMRLPDTKRYHSAMEVLHEAGVAPSRAEGDFMGANPNLPDAESDGGPPAWGDQSGVYARPAATIEQSGSATDTEGLLPGETQGREPASGA